LNIHYWHIYANGSGWPEAVQDHLGVLDSADLFDVVSVGIVGSAASRRAVKYRLPAGVSIVAEANDGWEQVTLSAIDVDDADVVAYSHTKGAANDTLLNQRWRRYLEHYTFGDDAAIDALIEVDVVCPNWLTKSITGTLPPGCSGFSPGNYWWATGAYLNRLPLPDVSNRYAAETWIGMGQPTVAITDGRPWDPRNWT
jgi:hypothetical protein